MPQRYGQHFLSSPHILERIATAACGAHTGTAVEIGPGRGALTRHLLSHADRVIAIEIDPALAAPLRSEFANEPNLTVVEGNALDHNLESLQPDVICGNLPYYAATPILERSVRVGVPVVALIQKEVADRLVAKPGSRDYGFLTLEIALFARANLLFTVKPGSFRPPPQVDSAAVRLDPHPRADELGIHPDRFLKFLSAAFRHKRKMLRNNIPGAAGQSLSRRAEQCSLEELVAIYKDVELQGLSF